MTVLKSIVGTIALLLPACFFTIASGAVPGSRSIAGIEDADLQKITFDLTQISAEGLMGSGSGLRSLNYEFCIPAEETYVAEIEDIDPDIHIYRHSRGRIGCTSEQYLCVNEAYGAGWQTALLAIAQLDYVERIDEFFAE